MRGLALPCHGLLRRGSRWVLPIVLHDHAPGQRPLRGAHSLRSWIGSLLFVLIQDPRKAQICRSLRRQSAGSGGEASRRLKSSRRIEARRATPFSVRTSRPIPTLHESFCPTTQDLHSHLLVIGSSTTRSAIERSFVRPSCYLFIMTIKVAGGGILRPAPRESKGGMRCQHPGCTARCRRVHCADHVTQHGRAVEVADRLTEIEAEQAPEKAKKRALREIEKALRQPRTA